MLKTLATQIYPDLLKKMGNWGKAFLYLINCASDSKVKTIFMNKIRYKLAVTFRHLENQI